MEMRSKGWRVPLIPAVTLALICLGASVQAADYAGSDTCVTCHEDAAKSIKPSVHGAAKGHEGMGEGCEACHGPGKTHAQSQGKEWILGFKATDSAKMKADMCLSCHAGSKGAFDFKGADHTKGSVTCADCHSPHKGGANDALLAKSPNALCIGCHQEMMAKTAINERHRVWEGVVNCIDCHEQHGKSTRSRLGGFNDETCNKCHTDKQGPFVYEHGASRVEGCTSCHDPHGSVNRHLLKNQRVVDLCYSCHTEAPSFHVRFTKDTQCTNCHSAIHGSNLDATFLK